MQTQPFHAGSVAVYTGPGKTEAWRMREGIECVVQQDTPFDATHVPVVFDCEEIVVNVRIKKLTLVENKSQAH